MTDREIVEKIDEIIGKIDYMEENPKTGMAVNDWFLNPRIDHNETTLEAAIMRKE